MKRPTACGVALTPLILAVALSTEASAQTRAGDVGFYGMAGYRTGDAGQLNTVRNTRRSDQVMLQIGGRFRIRP